MVKMSESVTGAMDGWVQACKDSVLEDKFPFFRQNPSFINVVEGTPKYAGRNLFARVRKSFPKELISIFATSENIGAPLNTIRYKLWGKEINFISPTTLRYANNLNTIIELFDFDSYESIYEIGAGYGGEAKIIFDYIKFKKLPKKRYTVFDLATSFPLIRKFLANFGYQINEEELSTFQHSGEKSLVISNGAFSEMRRELQELYFKKVIQHSEYGYFITNFDSHSVPFNGWSTDEFVNNLLKCGKNVQILSTGKYLSWFDDKASTKLIVFGSKGMPRDLYYASKYYYYITNYSLYLNKLKHKLRKTIGVISS